MLIMHDRPPAPATPASVATALAEVDAAIATIAHEIETHAETALTALLNGQPEPPPVHDLEQRRTALQQRRALLERVRARVAQHKAQGQRAAELGFAESLRAPYLEALGRLRWHLEQAQAVQREVTKVRGEVEDAQHRAWCLRGAAGLDLLAGERPPVSEHLLMLGARLRHDLTGERGEGYYNVGKVEMWMTDADAGGVAAVPPTKGRK